jgi:hypothetical protein
MINPEPGGVVSAHPHDELRDRGSRRGPSRGPACRAVVFLRHKIAVPPQQSVGGDDTGDSLERGPSQGLGSDGQPAALFVAQSHTPFSKLLSKDPIFFDKVLDA